MTTHSLAVLARSAAATGLMFGLAQTAVEAQRGYDPGYDPRSGNGGSFGGGLAVTVPTGEFADLIDPGVGFGLHGVAGLDRAGVLGIRFDAVYSTYGAETFSVPFDVTIPGSFLTVRTRSHVGLFSLGPQLRLPVGPLRPYVNGLVGLGYFYNRTTLGDRGFGCGCGGFYGYGSTTSFSDVSLAYGAGGGFDLQLGYGRTPLFLNVDAQFRRHDSVDYVPRGGVYPDEFGNVVIAPIRSSVDFWLLRVGVSVGL